MKTKRKAVSFYRDQNIVNNYMDRRFEGFGGKFVNRTELDSLLRYLPGNLKGKEVADLGSGTGRLTLKLLKFKPKKLYAVDASSEMLKSLSSYKGIKALKGLSEEIPLKDSELDLVVSLRLFEHLDHDMLGKTLKEVSRVLKKNGKLIFNTVNNFSQESILVNKMGSSSSDVFPITNKKVKFLLKRNGFVLKEINYSFILPRGIFMHAPLILLKIAIPLDNLLIHTPLKVFANHIAWYASKES